MRNNITILTTIVILSGCMVQKEVVVDKAITDPASYEESVYNIPRHEATPAQLALMDKLEDIWFEKMEIINNRFVFTADREYFIKNGISPKYYDFMMDEINKNNKMLESVDSPNTVMDLKKDFERWKKRHEEEKNNNIKQKKAAR